MPLSTVIAGCGYIGRALALALESESPGQNLALSRSGDWRPREQEKLPTACPIALRSVNIPQAPCDTLGQHLAEAQTLVLSYAAGRQASPEDREALYLESPRRLLPQLRPGARVIALSSTSSLPDLDALLDESCTLAPSSARGRLQRSAEEQLWQLCGRMGLELVILRLAGIYGPGRERERLYGRLQEGLRPGDGHVATNLVHRDDIVQSILAARSLEGPVHRLLHLCGNDHPSRREMIDWAHRRLNLPPPRWEREAPAAPPRGKRVDGRRLQSPRSQGGLGVILRHPHHRPAEAPN